MGRMAELEGAAICGGGVEAEFPSQWEDRVDCLGCGEINISKDSKCKMNGSEKWLICRCFSVLRVHLPGMLWCSSLSRFTVGSREDRACYCRSSGDRWLSVISEDKNTAKTLKLPVLSHTSIGQELLQHPHTEGGESLISDSHAS